MIPFDNCPLCHAKLSLETPLRERTRHFCKNCPHQFVQAVDNESKDLSYYSFNIEGMHVGMNYMFSLETLLLRNVGQMDREQLIIPVTNFKIDFNDLKSLVQKLKVYMTFS